MATQTRGEAVQADIAALLKSRHTLLWVVTREELRVERAITDAGASVRYETRLWDCATGLSKPDGEVIDASPDPGVVIKAIRGDKSRTVYILRDWHKWLADPFVLRGTRSLARSLEEAQCSIVVLTPIAEVPPELAGHATVIDYPIPDRTEIARILDEVNGKLPETSRLTNGARDTAIDAAVGLTAQEAGNCYFKSAATLKRIDAKAVANEKKRVIAREKVLTWHDPDPRGLDGVGGLELLKTWLVQRRAAFSPKAKAYGLDAPKGALLVGIPGCLAAGTRIEYLRGKRKSGAGRSLPIEVLYEKFNGYGSHASPKWTPGLPTYTQSWDPESGRIVYNEITGVSDSGIKPCVRIVTVGAGDVELTADHPVLMEDGTWRAAGDIAAGEKLLVRGSMSPVASGTKRTYRKRVVVEGLKYHPLAWRKVVLTSSARYEYQRTTRARLVIEARMNRIEYDEFIRILKEEPERAETLAFLPVEYDVHHADEDPMNDSPDNLVVVPHEEHARFHGDESNFHIEYTIATSVAQVVLIGERRTFDLTMSEPHTNFVVNRGIVVHNCGKSLTAKCIAAAWGMPLLRLDMGALQSKWVGESQANIRKALQVAEAVSPCILWLDEIEKALAGATQGAADGGVSADALGAVLSWMQERTGSVFVVATANDVSSLPPELLRKGRFDEVWWIDLPTRAERKAILAATLTATRGTWKGDAPATDLDAVADATADFTGAELAAIVPDALFVAFADDERQLTTDDLLAAARNVVPLAKTAAEKITRLREWAKGRARPASKPEATGTGGGRKLDL